MALKTYVGSCHCKKVRYEADLDLSKGTGRCNCSFCAKSRNWSTTTKPEHFRLLTDEKEVGTYEFNTNSAKHSFCKTCGIRTFTRGFIAEMGGAFVSVSIPTLENASPEEIIAAPLHYADGLHNNWMNPPKEIRHL